MGAPYEFWVGSNVGIGTSVGQIRVNDAMGKSEVSYDLLHSYEDGGSYTYNAIIKPVRMLVSAILYWFCFSTICG